MKTPTSTNKSRLRPFIAFHALPLRSARHRQISACIILAGLSRMKINILAGLLWLPASALFGQEFRGAFSGAVTDAQGAAIAKAKIVATEIHTGAKAGAVSADSGSYTIPFLAPGEYEIAAEAPGFKRFVRQGVTLSAGERPVIDIRLEVGAVSDSVM